MPVRANSGERPGPLSTGEIDVDDVTIHVHARPNDPRWGTDGGYLYFEMRDAEWCGLTSAVENDAHVNIPTRGDATRIVELLVAARDIVWPLHQVAAEDERREIQGELGIPEMSRQAELKELAQMRRARDLCMQERDEARTELARVKEAADKLYLAALHASTGDGHPREHLDHAAVAYDAAILHPQIKAAIGGRA